MVKKMWIFSSILAYEAKRLAGVRLRWLYSWLKKQEHACIFSMSVQHASWNFSKINRYLKEDNFGSMCFTSDVLR